MGGVPPYLVLLRVGFALPAALLRRRCALTAPFHPYPAHSRKSSSCALAPSGMSGAVYFLWHFPSSGLQSALPDVIRHTALRSSDFPPRRFRKSVRASSNLPNRRGDRPAQLPTCLLYSMKKIVVGRSSLVQEQVSCSAVARWHFGDSQPHSPRKSTDGLL
jgi:hypothetical protein